MSTALRIVCYHETGGGGLLRFIVEMTSALARVRPSAGIEFVSHGPALRAYATALRTAGRRGGAIAVRDIRPPAYWRTGPRRLGRIPGTRLLAEAGAGSACRWGFTVPEAAHEGCDVVWLPVLHNHRVPGPNAAHTVATFHGTMNMQPAISALLAPARRAEVRLTREAVDSAMAIITGAHATVESLWQFVGPAAGRMAVIPNAALQACERGRTGDLPPWSWVERPFIIYPAALHAYKNHAMLFEAFAERPFPGTLVLTGVHSDLPRHVPLARRLRREAALHGLAIGTDIIGLGYISDSTYYALLRRAQALVMPTLGEGGESFPVEEALVAGVPVLCSDIPPLREQVARLGGAVLWFDPRNPADLARRLAELRDNYDVFRREAERSAGSLHRRDWDDVARDYWTVFDERVSR